MFTIIFLLFSPNYELPDLWYLRTGQTMTPRRAQVARRWPPDRSRRGGATPGCAPRPPPYPEACVRARARATQERRQASRDGGRAQRRRPSRRKVVRPRLAHPRTAAARAPRCSGPGALLRRDMCAVIRGVWVHDLVRSASGRRRHKDATYRRRRFFVKHKNMFFMFQLYVLLFKCALLLLLVFYFYLCGLSLA